MTTKHILFLVESYLPGFKSGGPVKTVYSAVKVLKKKGFDCTVVCNDRDLGDINRYENIKDGVNYISHTKVIYLRRGLLGYIKLLTMLCSKKNNFFHLNSYFSFKFSIFPRGVLWLIRSRKKVVLAPRGELSAAALTLKSAKKSYLIWLMSLIRMDNKFNWHFSTNIEKVDAFNVYPDICKYHVVNDLSFPISIMDTCGFPPSVMDTDIRIVSCSRISRVKNIEFIFSVLQGVKAKVCIDFYGPIEDRTYFKELEALVKLLPDNIYFKFCGMIDHNKLHNTLKNYNIFFHPSLSENYGHVIAEALFSGLPVLIGPNTPWSKVMNDKVGWWFNFEDISSFQDVIDSYIVLHENEKLYLQKKVTAWANANVNNNATILGWENIFRNNNECKK